MRRGQTCSIAAVLILVLCAPNLHAEKPILIKVTAIVASNQGTDIDLENDAHRDQLIKLFSYSAYKQVSESSVSLSDASESAVSIPGEYQFSLKLLGEMGNQVLIRATIEKGGKRVLDTRVSLLGSSPLFLGGPPFDSGNLIIVIERLS